MNKTAFLRVAVTLVVVALAGFAGQRLWAHYEEDPWTRDGRVRADVVQVAPDVSGLVTTVLVHDNQQVTAGTPLFEVDRPRYRLAVAQAEAAVAAQQVQLAQARREARRNRTLGDLVAGEVQEQSLAKVAQIDAALAQARTALDTARLNLARTEVRASVAGMVSNLDLRPGDYASAGHPEFAIIDQSSLHIIGYFEETKLARIHVGDPVQVRLMGDRATIAGHVQSIAGGIEDRDRNSGASLLANVNPTFSWVRLAQRIPVRVAIDRLPAGTALVVGRTATVEVLPPTKPAPSQGRRA
ncbi:MULTISPECIES: HlyD family secretion protein [unclassified Sphingomonas]|jgi:RND family efflux transporter MFP subunit|uniref:efflux RND transporter periplasmic adaptor subunit n=1 Tax=unclassified Sphingomonas TaxID=196159 RepID=UPI000E108076|nr:MULTISPECIES: HlyD family secretion protein [unclassified Sphingomonas]AXJ94905.1 efflux transporter periplasmic adaptor subunit [Sphingomonas sp. FARSPH]